MPLPQFESSIGHSKLLLGHVVEWARAHTHTLQNERGIREFPEQIRDSEGNWQCHMTPYSQALSGCFSFDAAESQEERRERKRRTSLPTLVVPADLQPAVVWPGGDPSIHLP